MLKEFNFLLTLFKNAKGLEIGGPSGIFAKDGVFPIYPRVAQLDNCNFSKHTVWDDGNTFQPLGKQYIGEATDLNWIPNGAYDFVASSHMIEHTANPLLALFEWKRVVRDGGVILLVVPLCERTFDHRRPVSLLTHLIEDFESETKEDDLTHLSEILLLHDLSMDAGAGDLESFKARSLCNFENRCLHHHVFDVKLVKSMLSYVGLSVKGIEVKSPYHIFAIAVKE